MCPVASIKIILRGEIFFPHREGDEAKPEARRAETEAQRAESGGGVLGEGLRALSPPARGSMGAL